MAEYLQRVGEQPSELLVEEWNLLSVENKNAVGSRRAAWRVITSVEQKEKFNGKQQLASHAREHVAKVEGELQKIRDGILGLMDKNLVSSACTGELQVFYYKMKSDYYRYLAEVATCEAKSKAVEVALVSQIVGQVTEVPRTVSQDRIQQRTLEQIVDTPVPQVVEELAETSMVCSQDRVQQSSVEQTIETPAISLAEKIVEVLVIQTQGKTQQSVNTHVQHVVNTAEVERPKIIKQTVQKPIIQEKINQVTKHIEVPLFLNKIPDMSVVAQRLVHMVQKAMEAPQVQVVEKTVEGPQLQIVDKTAEHASRHTTSGAHDPERAEYFGGAADPVR